jgi:hypothetical protein
MRLNFMKYQIDAAGSIRHGMRLFNALFFEKKRKKSSFCRYCGCYVDSL